MLRHQLGGTTIIPAHCQHCLTVVISCQRCFIHLCMILIKMPVGLSTVTTIKTTLKYKLDSTIPKLVSFGGQIGMFYVLKSLIFNGSCSNFKHLSLKIGHIFWESLKTIFKNKNFLYLTII